MIRTRSVEILGIATVLGVCAGLVHAEKAPTADGARTFSKQIEVDARYPEVPIEVYDIGHGLTVRLIPANADGTPLRGKNLEEGGSGGGGACPQVQVSHTNDSFFQQGASVNLQAGFAENEIAIASYPLAPDQFPLQFIQAEMVFGQNHANSTTTEWSFMVWEGPPSTGTLLATFSTTKDGLPPITLPAGGGATFTIVQVTVDPGDPEQINIADNGSATFSVGFRVDQHNNQTQDPCFTAPPASSNAFPATDTNGLSNSFNNWIDAVDCDPLNFGCPFIAGLTRFADCPSSLPSGDWVIRAIYLPLQCPGIGACCFGDGSCQLDTQANCTGAGGLFEGDGTSCTPNPCQQPTGACCHGSVCSVNTQSDCEVNLGGVYQGDSTACNGGMACDAIQGACCLGMSCFPLFTLNDCENLGGGTFIGFGTDCTGVSCPVPGACCMSDGSCSIAMEIGGNDCTTAGGNYLGDDTDCMGAPCVGACCIGGDCFPGFSGDGCVQAGGLYQGDSTDCTSVMCPDPLGACCFNGAFCNQQTESDCLQSMNNTWSGPGSMCDPGSQCPSTTPPCPWDCTPPGGNGIVNIDDLLAVVNAFTSQDLACDNEPDNGDGTFGNGVINIDDLLGVINNFGNCPS